MRSSPVYFRIPCFPAVNAVLSDAEISIDPKMSPPSDLQAKLLQQIVLSGLADHVAR
jgi:ATP-dependent RNA helicase DHX37/DHR1